MRLSRVAFLSRLFSAVLSLLLLHSCERKSSVDEIPYNVLVSVTEGKYNAGTVSAYPKLNIQVRTGRTSRWDVRVEPEGGEDSDDVISFQTEPNYINEVVLDGDAFLRVGLNSAVVRVAPTGAPGDGCSQRVDYIIYEETRGQEPENRLMVGEDTYAVGEAVELEAGVHGFVFMLVCEKNVRCVPSVSVNDINVGITGNGSLGGGWRAFSGRLEAQEPAVGELTFRIIGDDMSMEYAFPLCIRKEGGGGGTDAEVTFERNGAVVFRPDFICVQGKIMDFQKNEHSVEFALGGHAVNGVVHDDGTFEVEAESRPLKPGRYAFTVEVIDSSNGTVVDTKSFPVYVMDFSPALYEQGTWTENWNRCIQRGIGKNYVLKVETGASANIKATATNGTTGSVSSGYFTQDGMALLFPLKDNGVALGPQVLTIDVYETDDNPITSREVTITGWDSYCCKYTIENNTVFSKLSGPKQSFPFALHFSVSAYLVGVIPYTEAITIGNRHYDKEVFEFVNIDSIGMTFDQAAGESFTTKSIFSSSYLRYAGTYLNGELKKIHVAHTATRWKDDGTVESYWPTPYLQAEIIYKHTRNDGSLLPEYWEIVYDDESVKRYFQGLGVVTKIYHAN